jgi:hypothetical protein
LPPVPTVAPVPKDHDLVRSIQPTWHCLLRFRQRVKLPPGTDATVTALRKSLEQADISPMTPPWVAGRDRGAQMWALDGDLAYPLSSGPHGEWIAPTCLRRGGDR